MTRVGYKHTEETRKKMSLAHKGKQFTPEQRANMGRAATGRKHTEESKQRISQAKKGKSAVLPSDSVRKKMSEAARRRAEIRRATTSLEEIFWSRVDKNGPTQTHTPELGPCWIWTGSISRGYGSFKYNGILYRAHRLAWSLAYGPFAQELKVCHRCDNPPCVRFDHLFLGTDADNIRDRNRKGRQGQMSEEGRYRVGLASSSYPRSALTRERISAALKGIKRSAAVKRALSLAHMGLRQSPETRAKRSESLRKFYENPEAIEKLSRAQKARQSKARQNNALQDDSR